MLMDTLFKLNNVSSGYGTKVVLKSLSFEIREGEFFGIIGPNGSGKTTLLKTMTHVLNPVSGTVLFRGTDIPQIDSRTLARDIAFVPQETLSAFSFNVMEIVLMGRYPHISRFEMETKRDYNIAKNALKTVTCLHLASEDLDEISAGERQRVMIAKALAQEPNVLMLDEPTSRLDIGHQIEIFDIIKRLNRERGITVIAVLHDLNLAADYCDRLLLLDSGSVFKIGSVDEILTYQNIEQVYKTVVLVKDSPATKKPHVILVPKYQ